MTTINIIKTDSVSLVNKMNKYNFKEPYKVSMFIVESGDEVPLSELNYEEKGSQYIDGSERITSVCFENASSNIENRNNKYAVMPPNCNKTTEPQNPSATKSISVLSPHDQILNLHSTAKSNDPPPSLSKGINHLNDIINRQYTLRLSKSLICILKEYVVTYNSIEKACSDGACKKYYLERFNRIKEYYLHICREIVLRVILPMGENFNENEFLNKTLHIAHQEQNFSCSYKSIENVYKELINTFHKKIPAHTVRPASTQINNEQCNPMQQNLQNAPYYGIRNQTISNGMNLKNSQNQRQFNNITLVENNGPNYINKQNLQYDGKHSNKQKYDLDQRLQNNPTTCLFQYNSTGHKVRLDIDTNLFNNYKRQTQLNNYSNVNDSSHATELSSTNDVRKCNKTTESVNASSNNITHQNMPYIQEEPTRSTSRDSGFMSPCANLINELCNNGDGFTPEPNAPYITHVTSLNPEAKQIPLGICHVCGQYTKTKCIGCFKYYYCSNLCQNQDWSRHKFDCTNRGRD